MAVGGGRVMVRVGVIVPMAVIVIMVVVMHVLIQRQRALRAQPEQRPILWR